VLHGEVIESPLAGNEVASSSECMSARPRHVTVDEVFRGSMKMTGRRLELSCDGLVAAGCGSSTVLLHVVHRLSVITSPRRAPRSFEDRNNAGHTALAGYPLTPEIRASRGSSDADRAQDRERERQLCAR
jgi:hypothetical protein